MSWITDLATEMVALGKDIADGGGGLASVTYEPWISRSSSGLPVYGASSTLKVILEEGLGHIVGEGDAVISVRAKLTILEPLTAYETGKSWYTSSDHGREEPLDLRDRFTLPDGSTGPIVKRKGIVLGGTTSPQDQPMMEVWLGR